MAQRSKADHEKAFQQFLVARTLEGTSKLTGIPKATLSRWSLADNWLKRLRNYQQGIIECPEKLDQSTELAVLDETVSPEEGRSLVSMGRVEAVCLACLSDNVETLEAGGLEGFKPKSFMEVVNALEKVWKSRTDLLNRKNGPTDKTTNNIKINYLQQLQDIQREDEKAKAIDCKVEEVKH